MTKLERNLDRRGDCDVVSGPTARIGHGNVQGRSLATGGALFAGIPYAQPPVRARRFLPPAMSIGCLLTMPDASGLFERAILQSGACRHVISRDGATRVARRVLERVDVTETDWTTPQEVPAARLLDATRALTPSVVADLFEGPPFSPDTGATKVIDVTASIEDSRHAPLVSMWRAREPQPINHGNG
jgi:carboxylesterase type B